MLPATVPTLLEPLRTRHRNTPVAGAYFSNLRNRLADSVLAFALCLPL
jgi:hypothetical protein